MAVPLKLKKGNDFHIFDIWEDRATTPDVMGNLLFEDGLSGGDQRSVRALRPGSVRQRRCLANASGGLATIDDGSTRWFR